MFNSDPTPWSVAHQAPLSMRFSRKNNGLGCYFLLQGIFPTQGLLHCQAFIWAHGSLTTEWKGMKYAICSDMDVQRDYHTESSKSDKDKYMILLTCGVLKNGTNEHIYKTEMSYRCNSFKINSCKINMAQFSSVQSLSHVWLFATPWTAAACQASLSNTNSQSLLKLMSIESVMPSSHLILCHPCLLLPSNFPRIRVFSNELPKYGELQLQHQFFQWILRTDFLNAGLFGSSFSRRDSQESSPIHTSKASILQSSAFFIVQLSHPYMTTGKTIA